MRFWYAADAVLSDQNTIDTSKVHCSNLLRRRNKVFQVERLEKCDDLVRTDADSIQEQVQSDIDRIYY